MKKSWSVGSEGRDSQMKSDYSSTHVQLSTHDWLVARGTRCFM